MRTFSMFSIRTKLATLISLLIGAISLFIFLYFPARLAEREMRTIAVKAQSIAEMTAYSISPALVFEDHGSAEEAFKSAQQNEDLVYIAVVDSSGKTFAESLTDTTHHENFLEEPPINHVSRDGTVYETITPILYHDKTIGKLYLGISLQDLLSDVTRTRTLVALVSAIIFILGIVTVFGISTAVTGPLSQMVKTVEAITHGDLTRRANVSSEDEAGYLAASFNTMVDSLNIAQAELENINRDLEKRVEERTKDLQQEIEDRKKVEETLRESEERFEQVAESAAEWIWEVDAHGLYTYSNAGVEAILGYRPDEIVGKKYFFDLFLPEVRDELTEAAFATFQRKEKIRNLINPNVHKNGSVAILETNGLPILDQNGNLLGYRGADTDITERKQSEMIQAAHYKIAEAATSTKNLDELYRSLHGIVGELMPAKNFYIALHDPGSNMLSFPYFVDEFDDPPAPKRPGHGLTEYVLRTGKPLLACPEAFEELVKTGEVASIGAPSLDWLGVPLRNDGKVIGVLVVQTYSEGIRYNTEHERILMFVSHQVAMAIERKRAEEEVVMLAHAVMSISECVSITDKSNNILFVNDAFLRAYGYTREEVIGMPIGIVRSMNDKIPEEAIHAATLQGGWHGEILNRRKDGSEFPVLLSTSALRDETGKTKALIGVAIDITERNRAQQQIQDQAALLDITRDAILVLNLHDHLVFWNKAAERIYGWTAVEVLGKNPMECLCKTNGHDLCLEARRMVVEKGEWAGEMRHATKDGRDLVVESQWTLVHDRTGVPKSILVVNTDITEKKKLEAQFHRSQRLEIIGTLAGGIAHDLNNVLSPILMALQLLQGKISDGRGREWLATLETSAKRGADIVKQVLTFARGAEGERVLLQPKHLMREVEKIARETFPRAIEIRTNIAKDLWTISGDATQLHQVLMNLCVNARDAMPNGGTLVLKAENTAIDADSARLHLDAKTGPYVRLSILDTGTGIPADIIDKIFDPFFTTKEVGKGTGLGLSTVLTIVRSHGGFVTVESKVGAGTDFQIYLPSVESVASARTKEADAAPRIGNGETILLVDDEASVRDITKGILELYGYHVLVAGDGMEAITVFNQHHGSIDAVITDMMMPNLDGASLIRTIRQTDPRLKIIAVSGLTDLENMADLSGTPIQAFLPKPFKAEKLIGVLSTVLESAA